MQKRDSMDLKQRVKNRLRSRVLRGARRLDRIRPSWPQQVDLTTFHFSSCTRCIAGQLGWKDVNEGKDLFDEGDRSAYHGFDVGEVPMPYREGLYSYMEGIWRAEILKRRTLTRRAA